MGARGRWFVDVRRRRHDGLDYDDDDDDTTSATNVEQPSNQ
jgi:hypothetical protein